MKESGLNEREKVMLMYLSIDKLLQMFENKNKLGIDISEVVSFVYGSRTNALRQKKSDFYKRVNKYINPANFEKEFSGENKDVFNKLYQFNLQIPTLEKRWLRNLARINTMVVELSNVIGKHHQTLQLKRDKLAKQLSIK